MWNVQPRTSMQNCTIHGMLPDWFVEMSFCFSRYYFLFIFVCYSQLFLQPRTSSPFNSHQSVRRVSCTIPVIRAMIGYAIVSQVLYDNSNIEENAFWIIYICDADVSIFPIAGYIFYPPSSRCYAAYRKGPCDAGNYLILPKSRVIPECVRNPCIHENYVNFRGNCYQLDQTGPCPVPELMNVIGVNETTLDVICTLGYTAQEVFSTATRFGVVNNITNPTNETIFYNRKECFIGGKRWTDEKCPQQCEQKNIDDIFSF